MSMGPVVSFIKKDEERDQKSWQKQRQLTKAKTFLVRCGNTGGSRGDFQHLVSSLRCSSSHGNITYKWSAIQSGVFFIIFKFVNARYSFCDAFRRSSSDNNLSWDNFAFSCARSEFGHIGYQGQPYPMWVQVMQMRTFFILFFLFFMLFWVAILWLFCGNFVVFGGNLVA